MINHRGMPIEIPLKNSTKTVLIDETDYETVSKYEWWYANDYNCAVTRVRTPGKVELIQLHRLILSLTDRKKHVNHKNDNKLDCRRENLEIMRAGKIGRLKAARYQFTNNPLPARTNIFKTY